MPRPKYAWEDLLDDLAGRPKLGANALPEPDFSIERERTYHLLKGWTGQDFGYDEDAWRTWMTNNPEWAHNSESDKRLEQITGQKMTMNPNWKL